MKLSTFVEQHLCAIKVGLLVLLLVIHLYAVLFFLLLWSFLTHPPIQFSIWILIYFIIGYKLIPQETTKTDNEERTRANWLWGVPKWLWGVRVMYVLSIVLIYSIAFFIVHSWVSILLSIQVEMLVWGIGVLLFCVDPAAVHSLGRSKHWSSSAYIFLIHQEISKSSTPVQTFAFIIERLRKKRVPEETIIEILNYFAKEDTDVGTAAKNLLPKFQNL